MISAATLSQSITAHADEPFLGEIMMTAASFCPKGWTEANGRTLQINNNPSLFSLMSTVYGGNGRTNFALPNFVGRTPIGSGNSGHIRYGQTMYQAKLIEQGEVGGDDINTSTPKNVAKPKSGDVTIDIVEGVRPPYIAMRYCISLKGQYPSRP
ncbi:MAG: phage tail protein [Robiginitomaculum sp.]|nr:MAG: phage tail protein [Robiginitomaculum sp.]